jgi:hypothetical protein
MKRNNQNYAKLKFTPPPLPPPKKSETVKPLRIFKFQITSAINNANTTDQ